MISHHDIADRIISRLRYLHGDQRTKTGKKGEFYIEENGARVAVIQYFDSADGQITVYHTEVDPSLRGQGVGEDLVGRVVEYARNENLKIVATCPYARKLIERNADLSSVLE